MQLDVTPITRQLSALLEEHGYISRAREPSDADARRIFTRCRAALDRFAPPGSAYLDEATAVMETEGSIHWHAEQIAAIVAALRDDYSAGAMQTVSELVHADVFDDLLEMARELLDKGYLGAAVVVGGAVLEEQLHKLASKNSIAIRDAKDKPKSADSLGVELRNAGVITEVERKSVAAWYGQRNEAAHGNFASLVDSDVERLVGGVRDFVVRHPA